MWWSHLLDTVSSIWHTTARWLLYWADYTLGTTRWKEMTWFGLQEVARDALTPNEMVWYGMVWCGVWINYCFRTKHWTALKNLKDFNGDLRKQNAIPTISILKLWVLNVVILYVLYRHRSCYTVWSTDKPIQSTTSSGVHTCTYKYYL